MTEIEYINIEDTYTLRKEVLRKNIDLPYKWEGDFDKKTFHLGLYTDNKLVCIASFINNNHNDFKGDHFQLRGMATHRHYVGKGYGKMLINKAVEILKDKPVDLLWCNARVNALGFYQKNNFKIIGEEFYIEKIGPHFQMFQHL